MCLGPGLDLQDSHYVPAGAFRLLREAGQVNAHPVVITQGAARQRPAQLRARLLCKECEQRLNKGGENWVLARLLRPDGRFALAHALHATQPFLTAPDFRFYLAGDVPQIDVGALSHFAAGIFWRGSIHPWESDGDVPIELGRYGEQLRQFLLGAAAFPRDVALHVYVRDDSPVSRMLAFPRGGRFGNIHMYQFVLPGLALVLYVGQRIDPKLREYCFVHGDHHPFTYSAMLEEHLEDLALRLRNSARAPHRR